jgi:hypothetical protein
MNNILTIIWKAENRPSINPAELERFLSQKPDVITSWAAPDRQIELHCFTFWPQCVNSQPIYSSRDSALAFDGTPTLEEGDQGAAEPGEKLFVDACREGRGLLKRLHGEFSAVLIHNGEVNVRADLGGSYPLYYADNETLTAFSNRASLLLSLPSVSDELDAMGTAWLSYQGYVLDDATSFSAIKKVRPGDSARVGKDKKLKTEPLRLSLLYSDEIYESFQSDPLRCFTEQAEILMNYLRQAHRFYRRSRFDLSLSGGKDSRMVLALLIKAGLGDEIGVMHTNGPLFSPEVLAAQEVARTVKLSQHQVNRPIYSGRDAGLNIQDLISFAGITDGLISAYDIERMGGFYPLIRISGSQDVLHDDHYTACRRDSLETFVEDLPKCHFHDPLHLLRPHVRGSLLQKLRDQFRGFHGQGIRVEDLGYTWMLRQRSANWTGVIQNRARTAGPAVFPLLHGDLYRFFFSLPRDIKDMEMVHFGLTYACCPALTEVPFANSRYKDTLKRFLQGLVNVPQPEPYVSHPSFPDFRNPFISERKVSFFNAMKPFMLHLLCKREKRLHEWLDTGTARQLLEIKVQNPLLSELICMMGLWITLLCSEYGRDLFDRTKSEAIAQELVNSTTMIASRSATGAAASSLDAWHLELIERHERSIAELACHLRSLQKSAQPPASRPAAPGRRARHIYCENRTDAPIGFECECLDHAGVKVLTRKSTIEPHSVGAFSFASEDGTARVILHNKTGRLDHQFTVTPTVEVYPMSVIAVGDSSKLCLVSRDSE